MRKYWPHIFTVSVALAVGIFLLTGVPWWAKLLWHTPPEEIADFQETPALSPYVEDLLALPELSKDSESDPMLCVSPSSLSFGSSLTKETFEAWNCGEGSLTYSISADAPWISVSQTSGSSTGEKHEITVTVNRVGLASNHYTAGLVIAPSHGPDHHMIISLDVPESKPELCLSTTSLDFGGVPESKSFKVWNCGGGTLDYTISVDKQWISVSYSSGSNTGEHDEVEVSVSWAGLSAGHYVGDLRIEHSYGASEHVAVSMDVRQQAGEATLESGTVLFFDEFEDGADSSWAAVPTGWRADGGGYKFLPPMYGDRKTGYAFVVTGKQWRDYVVELDLWFPDREMEKSWFGIIVRAQEDLNSMLIVRGNSEWINWQVVENGQETASSKMITPGFFVGWQHIRVEANGSTHKLFVKDLLRSTFSDSRFQVGMPGVVGRDWRDVLSPYMVVDNFRVIAE